MTTPAEVIAHARLAAHEERWGEGSGSLTTFREQAARDLDALAETGFMVVQKTASGRPVEVIETALRENMRVCAGVPMSGAEAGDALTRAGMVAVSAEDQQALRERAETAERRLAALDELHPLVELSWYHPCKRHSMMDEAGVLDSCPDCTASTYMGCPHCDDDCQVRAIIHPGEASTLPPEETTDARH